MCRIVTVGVAAFRGDVTAPFRAAGFGTRPAVNPTSAAMPRDAVRIDLIRVNTSYDFFGMAITQAQLIATVCVAAGCVAMWSLSRRTLSPPDSQAGHKSDTRPLS